MKSHKSDFKLEFDNFYGCWMTAFKRAILETLVQVSVQAIIFLGRIILINIIIEISDRLAEG